MLSKSSMKAKTESYISYYTVAKYSFQCFSLVKAGLKALPHDNTLHTNVYQNCIGCCSTSSALQLITSCLTMMENFVASSLSDDVW